MNIDEEKRAEAQCGFLFLFFNLSVFHPSPIGDFLRLLCRYSFRLKIAQLFDSVSRE